MANGGLSEISGDVMTRGSIYLNHAGTSWPKPRAVLDAVQNAMECPPTQWGEQFDQAHRRIATFFGIADPRQLLFTPGCTSSLAVAIGDVDLDGRNRVLTSAWEHHAMHRPLLKLQSAEVTVDYVPPGASAALDLGQLENQLSKGDVGLVAMTAAANVTGDLLPFDAAVALAHRHGAQVLLDAAQVVGWLDLDFPAIGADLIAFGGHKGLQAPWGIGGLFIADSARMKCSRATCELPQPNEMLRPGYCDVGSVDQVALAGLHAAVGWLSARDRAASINSARNQIAQMQNALTAAGVRCYGIDDPTGRMPTVAFSINGQSSSEVAASLRDDGIVVGSGLQCAPLAHDTMATGNEGLVRVSVGPGQDERDIQSAVDAISQYV